MYAYHFLNDERLWATIRSLERKVESLAMAGTDQGRRILASYQAALDAARAELERRKV